MPGVIAGDAPQLRQEKLSRLRTAHLNRKDGSRPVERFDLAISCDVGASVEVSLAYWTNASRVAPPTTESATVW